jgi:hypothetical protein
MARYIDADKIDYTVTVVGMDENAGYRAVAFESDIDEIPTADVVEVVRCKDCRHKNPNCNKCLRDNLWHDSDDFCSYGERKE